MEVELDHQFQADEVNYCIFFTENIILLLPGREIPMGNITFPFNEVCWMADLQLQIKYLKPQRDRKRIDQVQSNEVRVRGLPYTISVH
jgi:hypothetical protein